MDERLKKLFGTDIEPTQTRLLKAGPLSVELDGGNLRYIRYQGFEALRAVSYIVRDQYWGTYDPAIEDLQVTESGEGFEVTYVANCGSDEQSLRYSVKIAGRSDGSLIFEGTCIPKTDFLTNRTGFVVLHPIAGVSGHPVSVLHVDGTTEETTFPELIDPKQPISDIRALTHEVCPGLSVTCTMVGDTFEMEDQRNWTDASYKTYVRPIGLPHPFTLAVGEPYGQSISVSFSGEPCAGATVANAAPFDVTIGGADGQMPRFGMALTPEDAAVAKGIEAGLADLRPSFVSGYLDLRKHDVDSALADYSDIGKRLAADLALEVVLADTESAGPVLLDLARRVNATGLSLDSIAVTHAGDLAFVMPGTVFEDASDFIGMYEAARTAFPDAKLGGGNFVYFTELNRKPAPFAMLDFICHGTSAIVHAADDVSVMETLECLPYVIQSGRSLFGEKEYRIGPGGMGSRTNPFGTDSPANETFTRVTMTRSDPRQCGLLGAAWYLGYCARMAEGGVDSVVACGPVGDFGLVHSAEASLVRDYGGLVYPAYHVMKAVYEASGATGLETSVSEPQSVQALAFETANGADVWIANLTGEDRVVRLDGGGNAIAGVAVLDESSYDACTNDPSALDSPREDGAGSTMMLAPYAVARVWLQ